MSCFTQARTVGGSDRNEVVNSERSKLVRINDSRRQTMNGSATQSPTSQASSAAKPTRQQVLTPSTSSPLVAVQRSSAPRANSYSSTGASALLAKVASSPPSSNVVTPRASGPPSPNLPSDGYSGPNSFTGAGKVSGDTSQGYSTAQNLPGQGGMETPRENLPARTIID